MSSKLIARWLLAVQLLCGLACDSERLSRYLPAFRACIVDARAYSIMSAYDRTNGEPPRRDFSQIDEAGKRLYQPGRYRMCIGGSQPDDRSGDLIGEDPLSVEVELTGSRDELPY
jgi:hypothetical protein